MKKYVVSFFLFFTFCVYCYGQGEIHPRGIITPEEISDVLKQVKSNPTAADTFDKRLKTADVWIMLLIISGQADEVAKIAPPDTIPKIYELKMANKNDAACQKIDTLYLELEKIGLPEIPGNVKPPNMGEQRGPMTESGIDKKLPLHQHTSQSEEKGTEVSADMLQKDVVVDFSATEGEISPYVFGTTLGPDCNEKEKRLLKDAGFKLLMVMLPLSEGGMSFYTMDDFKKDLEIILDIDASPLFTLIPSITPKDEKQYFDRLKTIVSYINNEWVKKYPKRKWFFRFGNEPEGEAFWRGTQEEFFKMYATWAKTIKKINPQFIVGGPGLQVGCVRDGTTIDCSKLSPWVTNFLQYLEKNRIPLDFFSFHAYSPFIYMVFGQQTEAMYSVLAKYPQISPLFGIPKLANDEWNIITGNQWSGIYNSVFDQGWTAAHNVCALINMIHEGLWLSTRHGGICRVKSDKQKITPPGGGIPPPGVPPPSVGGPLPPHPPVLATQQEGTDKGTEDFLMVTKDGLPKPVYYAFKGLNQLSDTPIKLKVIGNDGINFAAISGKSKDNNKVTIVLANYDSSKCEKLIKLPPTQEKECILNKLSLSRFDVLGGYQLLLKNLPWSEKDKVTMRRYVVSDHDNLREVENKTFKIIGNEFKIQRDMASPSVHIITFEKAKVE